MLKDEYITEQTEFISKLLQTILFPKSSGSINLNEYSFKGNALQLQLEILKLIDEKNFNKAENLLFEAIESDDGEEYLQIAVWFYNKLSEIDKETLINNDFSYEEILDGLKEIEKKIIKI